MAHDYLIRSRRWVIRLPIVVLAAGLLAAACSSSSKTSTTASSATTAAKAAAPPTGTPIVLGFDVDSTGPGAPYSTIAAKTMNLAVDEINKAGGVLGHPLKVVTENDESDPTKTPAVVQKLASEGAKLLFLQSGGAAVIQSKATITQLGIPAIAPTSVTATVGQPPDNTDIYTLANATSDWSQVYCGAFAKAGIKTLGVLLDDTTTIAALNKALFSGMSCVNIVDQEKGAAAAADLNAQAARLKAAHPDAVLVTSVGGAFEVLAQNTLADQLPKVPRFSLASIGNQPSSWKLANPGALNGLIFMGSIDAANPQTAKLITLLKAKYGNDYQITAYDANGWDSIQLAKLAIEKAGGADDPKKLNDAIQSTTGYLASFGQPNFTISWSATKHLGADGLCGLSLIQFGSNNTAEKAWPTYQPPCSK